MVAGIGQRAIGGNNTQGAGAMALLGLYPNGVAMDFIDDSFVIRDSARIGTNFNGLFTSKLSCVRANATASRFNSSGNFETMAVDTLRIDHFPITGVRRGLLVEAAVTQRALWNRDMTNAAWVKTSTTAAKDQTGMDGIASSASSLLATGANATTLQTITNASTARVFSVFVKRITGSGTIQLTYDNVTWTTITITTAWTRFDLPTQTLANPIFGFRIVTSGNKIAVDLAQMESAATMSSPMASTTAVTTRGTDYIKLLATQIPISQVNGAFLAEFEIRRLVALTDFIASLSTAAGSANDKISLYKTAAFQIAGIISENIAGNTVNQAVVASITEETIYRAGMSWSAAESNTAYNNIMAPIDTAFTLPVVDALWLGSHNPNRPINGWLRKLLYTPQTLTAEQIQDWSAP